MNEAAPAMVYAEPLLTLLDELTTQTLPAVVPAGTVATMEVALQEVIVATNPLNSTNPVPWAALKFVPVIVTDEPTESVVELNEVMVGAVVASGIPVT